MRAEGEAAPRSGALVALLVAWSAALGACGNGGHGGGEPVGSAACAECHVEQAAAWESFSSHSALFDCTFCHQQVAAQPGPGHRATPACADCHSEAPHPQPSPGAATPTPAEETARCVRCHDPHGTPNLYLIRERLRTFGHGEVEIVFQSFAGRADDSYAELATADGGENGREPGSGLCEVCHDGTRVFDRTGIGPAGKHPTWRCTSCHDHGKGFLPD